MCSNREDYYRTPRSERAGYSFASKLEATLFDYLKMLEAGGALKGLRVQPKVYLTKARVGMIPDFYGELDGEPTYFEAKGFETEVWLIKKKLWEFYGPAPLQVFRYCKRNGVKLWDTVVVKQ